MHLDPAYLMKLASLITNQSPVAAHTLLLNIEYVRTLQLEPYGRIHRCVFKLSVNLQGD